MRRLVSVIALICSIVVIFISIYAEVRIGPMILRAVSVYVLSYIVLLLTAVLFFTSVLPGDTQPESGIAQVSDFDTGTGNKQLNESESQGNK